MEFGTDDEIGNLEVVQATKIVTSVLWAIASNEFAETLILTYKFSRNGYESYEIVTYLKRMMTVKYNLKGSWKITMRK